MVKLRGLLFLAALSFALAGTAHAQTDCGILRTVPPHVCASTCSYPTTYSCSYGHSPCNYIDHIVWCPCDPNVATTTAAATGDCAEAVQPTEKLSFLRTVEGGTRAFLMYVPNCKGDYSVEEIIT